MAVPLRSTDLRVWPQPVAADSEPADTNAAAPAAVFPSAGAVSSKKWPALPSQGRLRCPTMGCTTKGDPWLRSYCKACAKRLNIDRTDRPIAVQRAAPATAPAAAPSPSAPAAAAAANAPAPATDATPAPSPPSRSRQQADREEPSAAVVTEAEAEAARDQDVSVKGPKAESSGSPDATESPTGAAAATADDTNPNVAAEVVALRKQAKEAVCVICLEPHPASLFLCCGAPFHINCMSRWTKKKNTCPACRAPVPAGPKHESDSDKGGSDGDDEEYDEDGGAPFITPGNNPEAFANFMRMVQEGMAAGYQPQQNTLAGMLGARQRQANRGDRRGDDGDEEWETTEDDDDDDGDDDDDDDDDEGSDSSDEIEDVDNVWEEFGYSYRRVVLASGRRKTQRYCTNCQAWHDGHD